LGATNPIYNDRHGGIPRPSASFQVPSLFDAIAIASNIYLKPGMFPKQLPSLKGK